VTAKGAGRPWGVTHAMLSSACLQGDSEFAQHQQLTCELNAQSVHILHEGHAGMRAEISRKGVGALSREFGQSRFAQLRWSRVL
jgi:hypothetical protein